MDDNRPGPPDGDGDLVELEVGEVAAGGGCVARVPDGRVVFVRHALPGERVMARVVQEGASFLRADAVEILSPSPDRVTPRCPHAGPGRCGGCDYQHVELGAQRRWKNELVATQLRRVAGLERRVEVEALAGPTDGLGWRTRVRFAVDTSGRVGLRRHRSHRLELLDACPLATPEVEAVGVEGHRWPGIEELEVCAPPDGAAVVSATSRRGRRSTPPRTPGGLVLDGRARRPPDRLEFTALGRTYAVSPGVFWQVHPAAPSVLGQAVLDAVAPRPGERIVDLYAGAGLFTALLAEAVGPTGSVVAVERDARACTDAAANLADLPGAEIRRAAVTPELVAERLGRPDAVLLDPSREGAGTRVMAALAALGPPLRQIAYVSCDPATFARDIRVLVDGGWRLDTLRAFDLFPMTEHVELLGVLLPPASG